MRGSRAPHTQALSIRHLVRSGNRRLGGRMPAAFRDFAVAIAILCAEIAPAGEPDWAAWNPEFKDSTYVNDTERCYECHDEVREPFEATAHGRLKAADKSAPKNDCEYCHGPRSRHVEDPDLDMSLTVMQQGQVCQQCHEGGERMYWKTSLHASNDVGCGDCHSVMSKKSPDNLLAAPREDAVCSTCHMNVRGQINKASHHPIREGKMQCSSCHNGHGSVTASMLKGNSPNETCFECHEDKRGPYVWEHAPVRENCMNCHEPHGSNERSLQTSKDSFLCMQCHTYGGHMNLPRYNRTSNTSGQGCVNCHMAVHGSNSPSGAKLTR